ncbi:nitroreductase family protein [Nocardioides gilvus]|uniref:nitroreductase family protein n=1 Tax=Nocardioides gilvus TaxID=1735589 RepID=UPI0013A56856|nr:nitroreductase family protein [Nocardioides gilvus]
MLERVARKLRKAAPSKTARTGKTAPQDPPKRTPREAREARLRAALQQEMAIDVERIVQHSMPTGGHGKLARLRGMKLDAAATRLYHRVEKGFSLPEPRRPFGAQALKGLDVVLANDKHDPDALYAHESRAVLSALEAWNERGERDEAVAPRGDSLPTNPLDAETMAHFITSRRSIRDFAPTPVAREMIEEAVRVAMSAPSVCNRQGWRAYWFDSAEDLARVLPLHSGSGGFADRIPGVFVLTYDIRAFEGPHERNQGYIDGGLFSQNLLLALHGLGLGAVPLNWSRSQQASAKMRAAAGIPDHENILMLVAAGHPAEGYRVARSARRPLAEVLRFGMPEKPDASGMAT